MHVGGALGSFLLHFVWVRSCVVAILVVAPSRLLFLASVAAREQPWRLLCHAVVLAGPGPAGIISTRHSVANFTAPKWSCLRNLDEALSSVFSSIIKKYFCSSVLLDPCAWWSQTECFGIRLRLTAF